MAYSHHIPGIHLFRFILNWLSAIIPFGWHSKGERSEFILLNWCFLHSLWEN
jgi:hypothetical protein